MRHHAIGAALVFLLASGGSALPPVESGQPAVSVDGISGSPEALAVLQRARAALGGQRRLFSIKSLLITGTRTIPDQLSEQFSYRIMLPDRFQHTTGAFMFTVDGTAYWQRPDPGAATKAEAKPRLVARFAEQCLVFLLGATPQIPLQAAIAPDSKLGHVSLVFSGPGGFNRRVEFDSTTFRPRAFMYDAPVSGGGLPSGSVMTRRVTWDEFQNVKGIWFPARMTEVVRAPASIAFTSIRIDEGVSVDDFTEPKQ